MGLLFDRNIHVSFGKPGELGTKVKDLYVQFDIKKSTEPNPNPGTISIYNLNGTSRAALQEKNLAVLLQIGYGDVNVIEDLAVGKIHKAKSTKQGNDWVTIIELGDGLKELSEKSINTALGPGSTGKQLMSTLAKQLDLGIGAIKGLTEKVFQNGVTISGAVKSEMDKIADAMNLEWSVQDGNLQVLPRLVPSENLAIRLTSETGLIGKPVQREDSKKGGKYLEFTALPRTLVKPGVAINIESDEIDGFYKIRLAHFTGDNRSGPYQMTCEAVEIAPGDSLPNEKLT